MATETEKKFLVGGDFRRDIYNSTDIAQGYICSGAGRSVRIRIRADKGYITIKGAPDSTGMSRYEWEKEIPVQDARELMLLTGPGSISKTRHLIKNTDGRHIWEVDEFHGPLEGLVLAEIELDDPLEPFDRPEWLGEEVTGNPAYYNSSLAQLALKIDKA